MHAIDYDPVRDQLKDMTEVPIDQLRKIQQADPTSIEELERVKKRAELEEQIKLQNEKMQQQRIAAFMSNRMKGAAGKMPTFEELKKERIDLAQSQLLKQYENKSAKQIDYRNQPDYHEQEDRSYWTPLPMDTA